MKAAIFFSWLSGVSSCALVASINDANGHSFGHHEWTMVGLTFEALFFGAVAILLSVSSNDAKRSGSP